MTQARLTQSLTPFLALGILLSTTPAQGTAPQWGSYFGAGGRDHGMAIARGPGPWITIAGHTSSAGLATPGAFQATMQGVSDAFVARFDPTLPAGQQLLWCTYLGGTGMDLVFDLAVDASGIATIAGLTASPTFPAPTGHPALAVAGATDGFVAQLDPTGSVLLSSTLVGGSQADWCCEVEVDAAGLVTVAGVTESFNLPMTAGTVGPTYHGGGTDAFVARLLPAYPQPSLTLQWATYLGGNGRESWPFAAFAGWGQAWEGNLDRMAMLVEPGGEVVVATMSNSSSVPAVTTSNCYQSSPAAPFHDLYLVKIDATATTMPYATFYGGPDRERPKAIARHPDGGYVVGGYTMSTSTPVTLGCLQPTNRLGSFGLAADGFLCWLDPGTSTAPRTGAQQLRYGTYFGGSGGEDSIFALQVETSGVVTVAGYAAGATDLPVTPRCLQPTASPSQLVGVVARLELAGRGSKDLLYGTWVAGGYTLQTGLVLDEVGDAYVTGLTNSPTYPTSTYPFGSYAGGVDACLLKLSLLPGPATCVARQEFNLAVPACAAGPLYTGMASAPVASADFAITATNAPPSALGLLLLGTPATTPWPPVTWLVTPFASPLVTATAQGYARFDMPMSPNLPAIQCWGLAAQWVFLTNPAYPGTGPLTTSERLVF